MVSAALVSAGEGAAREAALAGDIGSVASHLRGVTYRAQIERAKEVRATRLLLPGQTWHRGHLVGQKCVGG